MRLSTVFFVGSVALFASAMLEAKEHGREHNRDVKTEKHRHQAARGHDRVRESGHERGHKRHGGHFTEHANRSREYSGSRRHEGHRRREEHRRHSSHHQGRHNDRDDYFWGGLVVGGLVAHAFDGYDHHSSHRERRYDHGAVYWSNRHGECFSVERRHHRDVYVEVPRHRCD